MLDLERIFAAADDVLAAAFAAEGIETALETFAVAAGARDAVLMRNAPNRLLTSFATAEAAEAVAAYAAGDAPPNSRYLRVPTILDGGFRIDHDDYSQAELDADPFYQEFLRPTGVFWHANAVLAGEPGDYLELSLKRRVSFAPYDREDVRRLDAVLPRLRAAARVAKANLDASARGMSHMLAQRQQSIVEIDWEGRVLSDHAIGDSEPALPLRIASRRLVAVDPREQPALDNAVAKAARTPSGLGLAVLTSPAGERFFLQVHPVPGNLRDVFHSAAMIAALLPCIPVGAATGQAQSLIAGFGLTEREAEVTGLLCLGLDLQMIAGRLHLRHSSVRTYLRNVFEKTGTRRQAELVSLVSRLMP